jgi:hypothetical protein
MDYKSELKEQLLSKTNINFLVNTILKNFKISNKAVGKCVNIITSNMIKYLNNIAEFPKDNNELIQAIHFLNKKCYDDFMEYLLTKYPNGNILRNNYMSEPIVTTNSFDYPLLNNSLNNFSDKYITEQNSVENYDDIIIITKDEKEKLIEKHNKIQDKHQNQTENIKTDEFLSYLTNPMVLQMFNSMINQMNNNNHVNTLNNNKKDEHSNIIFDKILDINQVQSLITMTKEGICTTDKKTNSDSIHTTKNCNEDQIEVGEDEEEIEIDLENLTNDTLILVQRKIKELTDDKNKYAAERNFKMVKQIEKERSIIMDAVNAHKQKIKKQAKENEIKAKSILLSNAKDPDKDNVEILNLQFDPSNDFNDLRNIIIGFKSDEKISEISLISYQLPFNPNNVTRFNNKFIVYFNNKINKITLQPSKYDINLLLDAIKSQANFLDFSIGPDNIITISNTIGVKFDLMVDGDDTIFPLLGFSAKADSYKDKLCYQASKPYDLDFNQKILINLLGSTKNPDELEFDKEIILQKPIILKKATRGAYMKQMQIKLTNSIGQCYDFIMPFKMCLRVEYIN